MKNIINQLNEIKLNNDENTSSPNQDVLLDILSANITLLFPSFFNFKHYSQEECLSFIEENLSQQIAVSFQFHNEEIPKAPQDYVQDYLTLLPSTKEILLTDIDALYVGDPAAFNKLEVVLTYPGFYAILVYRLAHILFSFGIPYIPRIFTEHAHSKTGIDIHPGARFEERRIGLVKGILRKSELV